MHNPPENRKKTIDRSGQVLIEVLIATFVLFFIAIAITDAVSISLRSVQATSGKVAGSFLADETIEAGKLVTKESWANVGTLATSSANPYAFSAQSGKWAVVGGPASVLLDGTAYAEYFYLDDVYRSTSTGAIAAAGGFYDPSTLRITAIVTWVQNSNNTPQSYQKSAYLSRFLNDVYAQTDWSGGAAGEAVAAGATSTFSTSSGVDTLSASNTIQLQTQ